ncbi:MAG: DegV family protein [Chloroflexota bacterium]
MHPHAVVTDSTSDIPPDEAEALSIEVIPALITVGGKSYRDGPELDRGELYRWMPALKEPATTAAPSPRAFESAYERLLASGVESVLSMHISSKLSAMVNVARQAAAAFGDRVHVFDSLQVSLGLGFQVMEAAAAALARQPFEAILRAARQARERARLVAMIDTLEYIRRSGRVSWLRAGLGELLKVKLLVTVADGVVQRIGEVRTRGRALEQLVEQVRAWGPMERLAVLHTAIPEEAAALAQRLRELSRRLPLVVDVTTVIGTHVGPGSIGLAGLAR